MLPAVQRIDAPDETACNAHAQEDAVLQVTLVAPPQLSRPLQRRKSKLPRLLSTAVSVAERLSLATAASLGRKRFSMPTFASHVKKAAEAEEGGHAAPAKG